MKCALLALLLVFAPTGTAFAQARLGELREGASAAAQQSSELRARESALQRELDEVAPRIELLKRDRGVLPSNELNSLLRRSQELSTQLTEIAQSLAAAEANAARRNSQLLNALSTELQRLEAAWDQTSRREAREALAAQLRALTAEREKIRGAMTLRAVPAPRPTTISQEPEDLLRQVDLLRDAEDKARRQLVAVEERIGQLRQEEALDRRMREFSSQQSLFDEQDRRFRLTPGTQRSGAAPTLTTPGPRGPTEPAAAGRTDDVAVPSPITRSAEKPPQTETTRAAPAPGDDLRLLEAQRETLRILVQSLQERSHQLEERARTKGQP